MQRGYMHNVPTYADITRARRLLNMPMRLENRIPEVRQAIRESKSYEAAARKLKVASDTLRRFCRVFDVQGPDEIYWYMRGRIRDKRPIAGFDELPRMFPLKPPPKPKVFDHPRSGVSSLKPIPTDRPLNIEDIRYVVCQRFGITRAELMGPARKHRCSHPRQMAMLLTRELTNFSLPKIARLFGRHDHTTVMYGIESVTERIAQRPEAADHYRTLKAHLMYRPANDAEPTQ